MNTILYRDKELIRTLSSPIYQYENRADSLKFLIAVDDLSEFNLKALTCMLCVILPDGRNGKLAVLDYNNPLYYDRYLTAFIPITKALTKEPGTLTLYLIFSHEDSDKLFHYLPTNTISFEIIESKSTDSFIDPDETTNPFTEMTQRITTLENSKISNVEINGHTVRFYSDVAKTILTGTIDLPEDVVWTTMEDVG